MKKVQLKIHYWLYKSVLRPFVIIDLDSQKGILPEYAIFKLKPLEVRSFFTYFTAQ